jgi:hypothetical protein
MISICKGASLTSKSVSKLYFLFFFENEYPILLNSFSNLTLP